MEIGSVSQVNGWTALTNVSSFMTHLEQRKQLSIFGELDAWLDFMQYLIKVQIHKADEARLKSKKRKKELPEDLVRALKTLKNDELIYYFNTLIQHIVNLIHNQFIPPSIQNTNFLIIESYTRSYNLRIWKQKKLRFDRQNHIIYAQKDKKIKIYDLGHYIVRRSSNNEYFCIVLEAINSAPLDKSKTVHIGFQYKNTYNLWFLSIQNSVRFKLWQKMGEILGKKAMIKEITAKDQKNSVTKSMYDTQNNVKSSSFCSENEVFQKSKSTIQIEKKLSCQKKEETSLVLQSCEDTQSHNTSIHTLPEEEPMSPGFTHNEQKNIIKESFTNRLLNQHLNMSLEELHFQCQRENQQLKEKKQKARFHTILLQNYQIDQLEKIQQFKQLAEQSFNNSSFNGKLDLYQNTTNPLNFKLVCASCKGFKAQALKTVLQHILNGRQNGKQNKSVQKLEIKCIVYSQNITINLEEHQSFNRLFRPRQFIYIRHLVRSQKGDLFVIDRSILQEMFKKRQHLVRGHLFRVTKISFTDQIITVAIDFTMRFNGDLRFEQEINHSKKYLLNLATFIQNILKSNELQSFNEIKFYDCSRLINEEDVDKEQEVPQTSINISFNKFQNKMNEELQTLLPNTEICLSKESSFYQIPRSNLTLDHNQSIISEDVERTTKLNLKEMNVRKTYSAPRKANKQHLAPRLTFLESLEEEHYDFKTEMVPPWTIQWQVDEEKGGLIKKMSNSQQKKILKQILQKAFRLTLLGKSSSKISFPIDILAPQSNLQRMVKTLSYAPTIFNENHKLSTLEKLKKTILYAMLTSLLSLSTQKAFISTLGQTFQGEISSKCKAYGQKMSTEPQKTALLLIAKDYSVQALVQPTLEIMMNSVRGQYKGIYKVHLTDNKTINFTLPPGELSGLAYGESTFQLLGKSYFWLQKQNIFLELNFQVNNHFTAQLNSQSKSDYFQGIIYEVKPDFMQKFKLQRISPAEKDIKKKIEKVCGRWTKCIIFQDRQIALRDIVLCQMNNEVNSLGSDSTFREDINQLKLGNRELAQLKEFQILKAEKQDQHLRKTVQASQTKISS